MKKTHPIFDFGKGSSSKSSKDSSIETKPKKSSGGIGGSLDNPINTPSDSKKPTESALETTSDDDERIVLKTSWIAKQNKRKSSPIPPEEGAGVREGWNSNCRWTYASNSSTVRERNERRLPQRPPKIYATDNKSNPHGRPQLIRIHMPPEIRPHQTSPEESCCKRFVSKCSTWRGKVRMLWRALMRKKAEWDRWNPNKENPIFACINESKLAGLKESIKPNRGILYRIMWVTLFFVALGLGTKMSLNAYAFHKATPILFAFENKEVSTRKLPFVSVTVCPNSSFKRSAVENTIKKYRNSNRVKDDGLDSHETWSKLAIAKLLSFMKHTCQSTTSFAARHGFRFHNILSQTQFEKSLNGVNLTDSPADISEKAIPHMKQASQKCDEMLSYCSWNMNATESCPSFVSTYQSTGGCCSFNKMPDAALYKKGQLSMKSLWSRDEERAAMRERRWGNWTLGNHFQDIHETPEGKTEIGPLRQADGGSPWGLSFLVTMDDSDAECPQFDSSGTRISISVPGVDVDVERKNIAIPPNHEVTIRLYPEVTIADDNLRTILPPSVRGCLFEDEGNLTYYRMYTQENCHRECVAKYIFSKCDCSLLSHPNSAGRTVCNDMRFDCVRDAERELIDLKHSSVVASHCSHCLPSCTSMTLRMETVMTPYSKLHPPPMTIGTNKTTSLVHAYYAEENVVAKVRQRRHSEFETISEVGSIYESTNDVSWLGVVRILVGLMAFIPTAYATYKLLQMTCISSLILCRKFNIRIFGLRPRLIVHPKKRPKKRVRFADEEAGVAQNETPQNEFPRSTNFDVFLLDSSHVVLPTQPLPITEQPRSIHQ